MKNAKEIAEYYGAVGEEHTLEALINQHTKEVSKEEARKALEAVRDEIKTMIVKVPPEVISNVGYTNSGLIKAIELINAELSKLK